jgi:RES domain-containing protein
MMQEADDEGSFHPDDFPPLRLLGEITSLIEELDLVKTIAAGTEIYRARPWGQEGGFSTARDLGPPPPHLATQANRMNPPGIPMTYAAETLDVAVCETRRSPVSVGRFRIERPARVLDLAELPEVPGIFAGAERKYRLGLLFIHAFTREITKPVDRDERVHIDYIPSQVVTEYIRSSKIEAEYIDGIRYPSALQPRGRNLVLFASQEEFIEPDGTPVALSDQTSEIEEPWIRLVEATEVTLSV